MTPPRSIEDVVADLVPLSVAARMLGVSEKTAKRWAEGGTFPGDAAKRDGRRWVVSVRRLDRYYHGDGGAA